MTEEQRRASALECFEDALERARAARQRATDHYCNPEDTAASLGVIIELLRDGIGTLR